MFHGEGAEYAIFSENLWHKDTIVFFVVAVLPFSRETEKNETHRPGAKYSRGIQLNFETLLTGFLLLAVS